MLHTCWRRAVLGLFPILYSFLGVISAYTDAPSAASFYVPSIPGIHWNANNPLNIFSGHLSAESNLTKLESNDITSHLFFVLVKNRRVADKQRIIFWFNGGPGCSSFDGLMMEVGPWRWDGDKSFNFKEGGWEEYTTVVYVDQPAGTGFSYTSTDQFVHDTDEASKQFLEFLKNFYQVFPEYKNTDTYLAGESFAGQWIPFYADAILNSQLKIPLKGVAIGNGWIDPRTHYPSYIDFAVKVGVLEENSDEWKAAKKLTDDCQVEMDKITDFEPMNVAACGGLLLDVFKIREKTNDGQRVCVNVYDVRSDDLYPSCGMNWPPEINPITEFLGRNDVVQALHATDHPGSWVECKGSVHAQFRERSINSSFTILPRVLSKIPVLIFAGDQDIICNYLGLENMIKKLTWNDGTGLGTVQTQSWIVDSVPAGTWVSSRNLSYVKIFNASHMAPYDVPHVAHDMMLRFMGVNFSAIVEGSARIPSSIGSDLKPVFVEEADANATTLPPAKTPEQDKAMWEAYYNAGSAALVLVLIFLGIGLFLWCRIRRRRVQLPVQPDEESIPLNQSIGGRDAIADDELEEVRRHKGKERALHGPAESPIFDVGDSDEDEDVYHKRNHVN